MTIFTESIVENAALAWLNTLGYEVLNGQAIALLVYSFWEVTA